MKIFIGGAWPYANNLLHVGHLAALLPGDVIARYYRKKGDEVIYVSGTDCHGTPITLRAKKENVNPSDIVAYYHDEFCYCFEKLGFSYDLYAKTCDDFHKAGVQAFFKQIIDNGYIHSKAEQQDFCPECNEFLSDREIEGVCPYCGGLAKGDQCDQCFASLNARELVDKHCKLCGHTTIEKENVHLIFELSKFQEEIQRLVDSSKETWRLHAISESIKYLSNGLLDRVATRQLTWGVDIPVDGFEDKKIYVWIEAVLGYLTAGKRVAEIKGIDFNEFMMDSTDLRTYYIHGKDNIPFHTIIFPALLLSLKKDIKLPDYIISSQYVNINEEKISKSKGNGVTLNDLILQYNADTIRYYMIANGPEKKDVNFSYEELEQSHNKHLVGEYGNFVNRNLAFLVKKFGGCVPMGLMDSKMKELVDATYKSVGENIEKGNLRIAISLVFELVQAANKYYDEQKPWIQVNEDIEGFNNTTYTCINLIANIANMLEPFLPESSLKVKRMLGVDQTEWRQITVLGNIQLNDVAILFNRIENRNKEIKQVKRRVREPEKAVKA